VSLTNQQEAFAREYAAGASGAEAARRSGYSEKSAKQRANELVRNPEVLGRIAEFQAETAAELGVTHRHLVTEALKYHEMAMRGEAPKSVGVRALDLAARLVGAFAPQRHEVTKREVRVTMNLERGDDDVVVVG
jgi:phage terminase small subunit